MGSGVIDLPFTPTSLEARVLRSQLVKNKQRSHAALICSASLHHFTADILHNLNKVTVGDISVTTSLQKR